MIFLITFLLTTIISKNEVNGWSDGAPCMKNSLESMNPLEAVEHQGGLLLTNPPYTIDVAEKCYFRNQPLEITLRGNTTRDKFKGFVIQPISYKGPRRGKRVGAFVRLDNNGSWQQQCFRFKDSVTQSHDEAKKKLKLWWKNEIDDSDYVQFVATVVRAQKEFWVKSVLSVPIPPCRVDREGIRNYVPEPVTAPPPVNTFMLDTFVLFDGNRNEIQLAREMDRTPRPQRFEDAFRQVMPTTAAPLPRVVSPQTIEVITEASEPPRPRPAPPRAVPKQIVPRERQRLAQIIPIAEMTAVPRPRVRNFQSTKIPFEGNTETNQPLEFGFQNSFSPSIQRIGEQSSQFNNNLVCMDLDFPARCLSLISLCRTHPYVQRNCRRTCRLC